MVIIPATSCFITHALIYRHVQSSLDRVQTGAATTTTGPRRISRRDVGLLRHSAIVLVIFVIGWAPLIVISIVEYYMQIVTLLISIFEVIFQLALLLGIIDLFLYNHKVRKYLIGRCTSCCRN